MSRRRFFAPPDAFKQQTVTLTSDEAKHLRDVLRLKQGDEVYVFDGAGKEFRCMVSGWKRDEVTLDECEQVAPTHPESPLDLTLAVALLKGDKFDLVVQKATELGITRIVPVMTRHADIHLRDASDAEKRVNRWRRIVLEAAKQCGRARVPHVDMPAEFAEVITAADNSLRVMFSEREGRPLEEVIVDSVAQGRQAKAYRTSVTALVGSEGGWANDEIKAASDSGWRIVTLGGRILRAETAAITVSVLLQHAFGDLR
ncbi:MAG TPA: 16S rRNA (uracil(1498)-N(3))-methyltransferase [Pyrinomonadaceae bacterium]|jgi:RNA methyltransferase, RsmE family|nr:16S rRNA (uracil(1498)-N(3))-methyltransferase [Pyrinomonadaceae bacterium]